jgi:predicted nucleotidyltransferase
MQNPEVAMPSVAVIAEFNPYHNGHSYLLKQIRQRLGEETSVTAIMSGSYVQRGELAVADPYIRAESALRAGYDLVLELPFPYCAASAETFARAGVYIADRAGVFDTLAFGCETEHPDRLVRIAELADSPEIRLAFDAARETAEGKKQSYGALMRSLLSELLDESDQDILSEPNNILAIEYLRALRYTGSSLEILPIKRIGGRYHATAVDHSSFVGATALRSLLADNKIAELRKYISAEAILPLKAALDRGDAPASLNQLSDAILAYFIALPEASLSETAEGAGGILCRISAAAKESRDLDELIRRASARSLTDSHVRRTILFSCLGVTSSELKELPAYTRVLGFRDRARALLRDIGRKGAVSLLTKTADYRSLPSPAREQAERSLFADRFHGLARPARRPASDAFRGVPCHISEESDT